MKFFVIGGAIGLLSVALYKALKVAGVVNPGIDPTTGGVPLAPGDVYGPPLPEDYASTTEAAS